MHIGISKEREKLCMDLTRTSALPADKIRSSALLIAYSVFTCVQKDAGVGDIATKLNRVPITLYTNPTANGYLKRFSQLEAAEATAIYNRFTQWTLEEFLNHIVPDLVNDVNGTIAVVGKTAGRIPEVVEQILVIKSLAYNREEPHPEMYALYCEKLERQPKLEESDFWKAYYSINGYQLPFDSLDGYASKKAKLIYDVPKKVYKLFAQQSETWEQQMSHVVDVLEGKNPKLIAMKTISRTRYTKEREDAFVKACKLAQSMQLDAYLHYGYAQANESDWPLELGFVYPQFRKFLQSEPAENYVAIFNANPVFIDQWTKNGWLKQVHVDFVFTSTNAAELYKQCYFSGRYMKRDMGNITFLEMDEWKNNPAIYTHGMVFANRMNCYEQERWYQHLATYVSPVDVFVLDHSHGHETCEMIVNRIGTNQMVSMALIPLGIPRSTKPSRKVFFHYRLAYKTNLESFRVSNYSCNLNNGVCLDHNPLADVAVQEVFGCNETPRAVYGRKLGDAWRKTTAKRNKPMAYEFCPELLVWYQFYEATPRRLLAYFCQPPSVTQLRRTGLARGKQLKTTEKTTTTIKEEGNDEQMALAAERWIEKNYAPKVQIEAAKLLAPFFEHKICSFKLFWYLHPELASKMSVAEYENIVQLVASPVGFVRLDASVVTFESAMIISFLAESDVRLGLYWKALSQLIDYAVELGILGENHLAETVEAYRKHGRNRIGEVRGALVKKTFTSKEMQKILTGILAKLDEGNPEYIGVLIRLATGLGNSVVSGLRWSDFAYLKEFELYQLSIGRRMSADGGEALPLRTDEQYRVIPCIPLLEQRLLAHRGWVKNAYFAGQPDKVMEDLPIVTTVENLDELTRRKMVFAPKQLADISKRMLALAGIDPEVLPIPEEDGTAKQTDANAYFGDIFKMNYSYYLKKIRMDGDAEAYLLGNQAVTTFGRRYYDPQCDRSQSKIYQKLIGWNNLLTVKEKTTVLVPVAQTHFETTMGNKSAALLTLPNVGDVITVEVESQYGVNAEVHKIGGAT